jgi:serine/threonine protein kinase
MVDPAQLEQVFAAAVAEVAPDARERLLDEACQGDSELRVRIDALLAAHVAAGHFLPLPEASSATSEYLPVSERPGSHIGRYKLLEQIGEGGFGVVFMAQQDEPIRRRVALKVIKPGMDTRQVVARFEAERQALAMMDHPNIAQVHEAGATETGRPYFVMELIRGVPITSYCDEHMLSIRERLELFARVCLAVQHAHQKGIIHRDLKPSNVLVTLHDDRPIPKVIDFGVAKAIAGKLTERTLFTGFFQLVGTPTYMSPEQAQLSGLDIDTRSDIYSLGVLLYELLTGTTPFEAKAMSAAPLDEMRRMICEVEPPSPSTRLSTLAADARTTQAQARRIDPKRFAQAMRGDLDWIVMRCLEKDRTRRYATANSLALDIERYLADEAVEARPPSAGYRVRKFARRNRIGLAVAGSIVVLLLAGIAGLLASNSRIRAEQGRTLEALNDTRKARQEAEDALADMGVYSQFLIEDVLSTARPKGQRGGLGIGVTVLEALDHATANLPTRFEGRPRAEAFARHDLGVTYRLIGEYEQAEEHLRRALDLRRKLLGATHEDTLNTMNSLAVVLSARGNLTEAVSLAEEYLNGCRARHGPTDPLTLDAMRHVTDRYVDLGRLSEDIPMLEQTLQSQREHLGATDPLTFATMHALARAYRVAGRWQESVKMYEETLERHKERYGLDHPDTLVCLDNLAMAYGLVDRVPEGLALVEESLRRGKEVLGPTHHSTLISMNNLALLYRQAGRFEDALPLHLEAKRLLTETLGPTHPDTLRCSGNLVDLYRAMERYAEAVALSEDVLKKWKEQFPATHPSVLLAMKNLSVAYTDAGQVEQAQELAEEVLQRHRMLDGPDHPATITALNNVAIAYAAENNWDKAIPPMEEALQLYTSKLGSTHDSTLYATMSLSGMYFSAGRTDEAIRCGEKVVEIRREQYGPLHRSTLQSMMNLAVIHLQAGQPRNALPLLEQAYALQSQEFGAEDAHTLSSAFVLGVTLIELQDYEAAEPLLMACQKAIDAEHPGLPPTLLMGTTAELVRLYEAWGKPEKADQWRDKVPPNVADGMKSPAEN